MRRGDIMVNPNVPHLDLSEVNKAASPPVEQEQGYNRLPEEDALQYMGRIVRLKGDNPSPDAIADLFIKAVVNDKQNFPTAIKELPSLKIRDAYNYSLLDRSLQNGTNDQIHLIIKELINKNELTPEDAQIIKTKVKERFAGISSEIDVKVLDNSLKELNQFLVKNGVSLENVHEDNVCEILKEAFLKRNEKYPPPNPLEFAKDYQKFELIDFLYDHIEKNGDPELKNFVNDWRKNSDEPVRAIIKACESSDTADLSDLKEMINRLDPKDFSQLIFTLLIVHSPISKAIKSGNKQVLDLLLEVCEKSGNQNLKEYSKNVKLLPEYSQMPMAKAKANLERNLNPKSDIKYRSDESKLNDKQLVARQNASTKLARQEGKAFVRDFLDSKFETYPLTPANQKMELDEIWTENKNITSRISFSIRGEDGVFHTYDIYALKNVNVKVKGQEHNYPFLSICVKDNQAAVPFLRGDIVTGNDKELLSKIFKGNRFEVYDYPENNSSLKHADSTFWDNWVNIEWKDVDAWEEYTQIIHPAMAEAAFRVLANSPDSTPPKILEIGGGVGRLAERVLEALNKSNRSPEYVMLEFNEQEIRTARNLLGKGANVVKTDIVADETYYKDEARTEPIDENSMDLVLGSGILTSVVLKDKEAALNALSKVQKYIKPGGYLILSGHAPSFLDSNDFKSQGFEVINSGLPESGRIPLYILRKTASQP